MPTRAKKMLQAVESGSEKARRYIVNLEARFGSGEGEKLGDGTQAVVYKVCVNCPKYDARKCYKKGGPEGELERDHEFAAWTYLSKIQLYSDMNIFIPDGPRPCIQMPLFDGTLDTQQEMFKSLTWGNLDHIIKELVLAIYTMATHNFVHGDIKPQNILLQKKVTSTGNVIQPVIGDPGSACWVDENSIEHSCAGIRGTVTYLSPEMINHRDNLGHKHIVYSDIYSLGIVIAECVWNKLYPETQFFKFLYPCSNEFAMLRTRKRQNKAFAEAADQSLLSFINTRAVNPKTNKPTITDEQARGFIAQISEFNKDPQMTTYPMLKHVMSLLTLCVMTDPAERFSKLEDWMRERQMLTVPTAQAPQGPQWP